MSAQKIKELKAELKQVRREMRELGIKRSSFMNAGHSRDSSRYNCECFRIESEIKRLEATHDLGPDNVTAQAIPTTNHEKS